nr:sigma-70 family RNA polymerase sigma factor [Caldisalinibacter kiritimatiensis]
MNREYYDDLIQGGYEVILNCLLDYDEERKVHFLGYVKTMLKYHYLDKHKKKEINISLNQSIKLKNGNVELIELIEGDVCVEEDIINKFRTRELIKCIFELTDRQRDVVIKYYIENKAIAQISKELNISYRTVVNTKTAAIRNLRKKLKQ